MSDVKRQKSLELNKQILKAEEKLLREKYWKRNRFCECGADSIKSCECSTEKKWRYMERVNRKINDELGEKAMKLRAQSWALSS